MRKGHFNFHPAAGYHHCQRYSGLNSDAVVQLFSLLSLYTTEHTPLIPSQILEALPDLDPRKRNPNLCHVFDSQLQYAHC